MRIISTIHNEQYIRYLLSIFTLLLLNNTTKSHTEDYRCDPITIGFLFGLLVNLSNITLNQRRTINTG